MINKLFIIGCGHTGTSLLNRILSFHSKVMGFLDETYIFFEDPGLITLEISFWEYLAKTQNKDLIVEKTPSHIKKIKLISDYYPESKFLLMFRDPRDVACSIRNRGLTFDEGLDRWVSDYQSLLPIYDSISHNVYTLELETFVKHPNKHLKKILKFLELPQEYLLNYYKYPVKYLLNSKIDQKPNDSKDGINHIKLRSWQVNQPINKNVTRYKEDMREDDWRTFQKYLIKIENIIDFYNLTYEILT